MAKLLDLSKLSNAQLKQLEPKNPLSVLHERVNRVMNANPAGSPPIPHKLKRRLVHRLIAQAKERMRAMERGPRPPRAAESHAAALNSPNPSQAMGPQKDNKQQKDGVDLNSPDPMGMLQMQMALHPRQTSQSLVPKPETGRPPPHRDVVPQVEPITPVAPKPVEMGPSPAPAGGPGVTKDPARAAAIPGLLPPGGMPGTEA